MNAHAQILLEVVGVASFRVHRYTILQLSVSGQSWRVLEAVQWPKRGPRDRQKGRAVAAGRQDGRCSAPSSSRFSSST